MAFKLGGSTPPPRFRKPPGQRPPPEPTLFEQLNACSWRDIPFPISSMKVTVSQDLVQHKYWGVDGASVEATGRAPLEIEAVIPFVNGIVPGKGEKWGVLYPTQFRSFLKAFVDKKTGTLVHPELGEITCKPVSFDFTHDAQQRDGVTVTARWVETVDEKPSVDFAKESPIKVAQLAALDLDASKDDLLKLVPAAEWQDETFESLVDKITGFVDSVTTTVTLLQAKPNQILYRIKRLQNSVDRAKNALTWPVNEGLEKLKEAWSKYKPGTKTVYGTGKPQTLAIPSSKKVSTFAAAQRLTVSAIVGSTGNSVDDLISLNPVLVSRPEVAPGTVIRYYAK